MSLLKFVDRIALLSLASAFLALPAAALECSPGNAQPKRATDATFQHIQAGMSAAEVLARLGPPYRKMPFERSRTTAWDYHIADSWTYDSEFSVIFDDSGTVVSKFTTRDSQ